MRCGPSSSARRRISDSRAFDSATGGKPPLHHADTVYLYDSFMFAVQRVKMRRIVVAKIKTNADAVESTEFRHRGSALSASHQASFPQQVCL